MKILCIDVGRGTQDILLYDSERNLENCIQLIIPSRAILAAKALKQAISEDRDILFTGTTMGGFPLGQKFGEYVKRRNVYATPDASRTFRDDPDVVREMGVKAILFGMLPAALSLPGRILLSLKNSVHFHILMLKIGHNNGQREKEKSSY